MQLLQNITHLVHIGFDRAPQLDFEGRVIAHLEDVADNASHVLNFVDEALYNSKDAELLQKNRLADALSTFINACYLLSTPLFGEAEYEFTIRDIPREVLDYMKQRLDGKWQQIQTPCKILEDWIATRPQTEMPDDIMQARDAHDEIRLSILGHGFEEILVDMVREFQDRNIFNIHISEGARNDRVANSERKFRLVEASERLLGKDRMIFSGMRDGDFDKLIGAISGDERDADFARTLREGNIEYHEWEKPYGNASDPLMKENRQLSIDRTERYRRMSYDALEALGFRATEDTEHLVGGEYYGRCVSHWASTLNMYGVPDDKIIIGADIGLVKAEDRDKINQSK